MVSVVNYVLIKSVWIRDIIIVKYNLNSTNSPHSPNLRNITHFYLIYHKFMLFVFVDTVMAYKEVKSITSMLIFEETVLTSSRHWYE